MIMEKNSNTLSQQAWCSGVEELIEIINPEVHMNLKTAVELGRWANGDKLSQRQREHCMQAVIAYESRHLEQEDRVGFIDTRKLKKSHRADPEQSPEVSLRWHGDRGELK